MDGTNQITSPGKESHDDDDDSSVCSESTSIFFSLEFHFDEKLKEVESSDFQDCVLSDSEVAVRTNVCTPSSSGAPEVFFEIPEVMKNMEISQDEEEEERVTYNDVIPAFNDALSDKEKLTVITKIGKI